MKNPNGKIPDPPKHLIVKGPGRIYWRQVLREFDLDEPQHLVILEQACSCLDRIRVAREEVEKSGAYFVDRWNQPKEHPALKTERDNKTLFARLMRDLALDIHEPAENRPPRQY